METKLNFWATLILGPFYLAWRGFLKEGLSILILALILDTFLNIYIFNSQSDLFQLSVSIILSLITDLTTYLLWPTYTSRFSLKKHSTGLSLTVVFCVCLIFGFVGAYLEMKEDMGRDFKKAFNNYKDVSGD